MADGHTERERVIDPEDRAIIDALFEQPIPAYTDPFAGRRAKMLVSAPADEGAHAQIGG